MLFGVRAGSGAVLDHSRCESRACDARLDLPCCGRRVHRESYPERTGIPVARESAGREGSRGRHHNECARDISHATGRSHRRDLFRNRECDFFLSPTARTDDPHFTRMVGLPLQIASFFTGPLTGYQWLPAIVFAPVLALWLIIKGVARPATQ